MNLDTTKKSQYHSALAKEGPLQVKVLSDVLKSKYRNPGESGHLYVKLQAGSYEFSYGGETEDCAKAFDGLKGRTVTMTAKGGRDDAYIEIAEKADSSAPAAPPQRQSVPARSTPPPAQQNDATGDVDAVRRELMKVANLFYLIKQAIDIEISQSRVNGIETEPAFFQAQCATAFIHLDKLGMVANMPLKPLWSIAVAKEEPKPGSPEWQEIPF